MKTINSEIIPFFNGKTIFLTGATGFIGKLLIDQLLRKCEPRKLYLLIRSKKGVEPKQRFEQLFQDILYERLKKEKPNFIDKVGLINGDLSVHNLGLNDDERKNIIENVNIVIHGGATVRFDEQIKKATSINVKGTVSMAELCHQIQNLIVFIHISTAYSNCPYKEITEKFYDPPISCENLIRITENVQDNELEILTKKLFGEWPNSYTFTKAVAEDAIRKYAIGKKTIIFRPSMIAGTINEPIPGWIDNLYGPSGLTAAVAYGVLRVMKADPKGYGDIVPGDMVVSSILAAIHDIGSRNDSEEISIYNFVTSQKNLLNWKQFADSILELGEEMPLESAVWAHHCTFQPNPILHRLYSFFLHFLPALLVDIALFLSNKNTGTLKLYRKAMKFLDIMDYFSLKRWWFSNENIVKLWNKLNKEDQRLFNFNMDTLKWKDYCKICAREGRFHIFKEKQDTVARALKKRSRQLFIQNVFFTAVYALGIWFFWKYLLIIFNLL